MHTIRHSAKVTIKNEIARLVHGFWLDVRDYLPCLLG